MFIFPYAPCFGTWDTIQLNKCSKLLYATDNLQKNVAAHCFAGYKSNLLFVSALLKSREIFENDHAHKIHAYCIKANAAAYFVF